MNDLLLPPASRLIHIGPHKTGSTAIQVSLHEARAALAEHGVQYGGRERRPRKAGWAIGVRGKPAGSSRPPMQHWHDLVADVQDAGAQRVCVSNEDFGRAEPEQIRQIVDELGGEEPHVVAVARRLDRYLPSQWQERVKAGNPATYEEWLRTVLDRPGEDYTWDRSTPGYDRERTNVWYAHDTAALVGRWADVVGPDRITLIVSDDSDRELLPRTFERMLGLPAGLLELYPDRSNRSLSWSEVEFIRSINRLLLDRDVALATRKRLVSRGLVTDLTSRPPTGEGPRTPPMPEWAATVVRDLSDARVAALQDLGVRIVGDPESLRTDRIATGDPSDAPGIPGATAARAVDWLVAELTVADAAPEATGATAEPVGAAARLRSLLRRADPRRRLS